MRKYFIFLCITLITMSDALAQQVHWDPTGGISSGRAWSLVTSPAGDLFACINDSIYISTDKGERWNDISGNLSQGGFTSIACSNVRVLFAAKGDPDGGVYRSTDRGLYWEPVIPNQKSTNVQTSSDGYVYALATVSGGASGDGGLYVSSDNGNSWEKRLLNLRIDLFSQYSVLSVSPNGTVFLCYDYDFIDGLLYRSEDHGITWDTIPLRVAGLDVNYKLLKNKIAFSSNGDCYASFYNDGGYDGPLCRSTDNGLTWHLLDSGTFQPSWEGVSMIAINSKDDIFVFHTSLYHCYRSQDRGKTWSHLGNVDGSFPICYASDSNGTLYLGTLANVYKNERAADNFSIASPNTGLVRRIVADQKGNLATSLWIHEPQGNTTSDDNTFAYSTDFGKHWNVGQAENTFIYFGDFILSLEADSNTFIIATDRRNYQSTNGGQTWSEWPYLVRSERLLRGLTPVKYGRTYLVHFSRGPAVISDSGNNYLELTEGTRLPGETRKLRYLTIARSPSDYLFVGMNGGVCRLKDGETVWTRCDISFNTDSVHSFYFHNDKVFAATTSSGVFESSTNGDTWVEVNSGLFTDNIRTITGDNKGTLFAATSRGVFKKRPDTTGWIDISSNIGSRDVTALCFVPNVGLYAGTRGKGIFLAHSETLDVRSSQASLFNLRLKQNRREKSITVEYSIPEHAKATVSLIDMVGNVCWRHDESPTGDKGIVVIPTEGISRGLYFVQFTTSTFSESRPIIN